MLLILHVLPQMSSVVHLEQPVLYHNHSVYSLACVEKETISSTSEPADGEQPSNV